MKKLTEKQIERIEDLRFAYDRLLKSYDYPKNYAQAGMTGPEFASLVEFKKQMLKILTGGR
jgi:hypothetical protein